MVFEWDENKELKNIKKHGIDFNTALHVFGDPFRIVWFDEEHSDDEDRYIMIGSINDRPCVLNISYTPRGEVIRLISARKATAKERMVYYDNKNRY